MTRKIFSDRKAFLSTLKKIKKTRRRIVFTNGCFDIVHLGHLHYLKTAARMGDLLIIGLNTDMSIKRLKGRGRPVNSFEYRSLFLSYLDFVDYIIGFEEDTPIELIGTVLPDILVKGGDYRKTDIVGYREVKDNGGRVVTIPFEYEVSTSGLIKKLKGKACR